MKKTRLGQMNYRQIVKTKNSIPNIYPTILKPYNISMRTIINTLPKITNYQLVNNKIKLNPTQLKANVYAVWCVIENKTEYIIQ